MLKIIIYIYIKNVIVYFEFDTLENRKTVCEISVERYRYQSVLT